MSDNGLSPERLTWMYTQMARIREFEERVKGTFEEHPGVIRGHTHLADGAEASIVGSLAALRPDDQLTSTYRGHGYPIALGTDTKALMAEIFGKETGICRGKGSSRSSIAAGTGACWSNASNGSRRRPNGSARTGRSTRSKNSSSVTESCS